MRRRVWSWLAAALGAAAMLGGQETSAQDAGFKIRVVPADGTGGRSIGGMSFAFEPAWSPDGSRIAFIGVPSGSDDSAQIFTTAPDGSGLTQVSRLQNDELTALAWSPDGTRIAFAAQRNGMRLGVINADGSGLRTLARSLNDDFPNPSWSPDGTRLTFVRGESTRSRLSVVNADGTGLRTLRRISLDTNEGGLPRWSPDGRRIAYVDVSRGGRFQVFTIRSDGQGRRRVGTTSCALDPVWRPDGRALACVGLLRRSGRLRFAVNVVGPRGRLRQSLPPGGSRTILAAPTWSPDGTKLTYLRPRRNGAALYVIDADGRNNRWLSSRPSAFSGVPATWSPDASQIAYGVGRFPG